MAEQMVSYTWQTGDQVVVSVDLDDSFPDSVHEAEASGKRLFAFSMGVIRAYDLSITTADELPPLPDTE